jgi:hypothetical protein
MALGETKPADVEESAHYRGTHRRYAQLRFGNANSVRVTVVVDEVGPSVVDLYVDTQRARRIEDKDRLAGNGPTWRLPLEAAFLDGNTLHTVPRTVVLRYGHFSKTLAIAAAGYVEGSVQLAGRTHRARRTDADGNGLFSDPRDRLWIDLDDNGRWDSADEQFLLSPILAIGSDRYAVRADERGARLSLDRLEGEGKVRLAVKPAAFRSRVLDLTATLVGRDGSALTLQGTDEALVSVGEYRLHTVTVVLSDPAGGPRWTYQFSDAGAKPGEHWYKVPRGGSVTIDPIGKLEFRNGLKTATAVPGKSLDLQPELYTGDGLFIVYCVRGSPSGEDREGCFAESVLAAGKDRLDAARSGFQ